MTLARVCMEQSKEGYVINAGKCPRVESFTSQSRYLCKKAFETLIHVINLSPPH